jgi:sialate O-acetylesterase
VAGAAVSVPHVFSEHMVLASSQRVPVWGKAEPGESVKVTLGEWSQTTTAGADGKWKVTFDGLTPAPDGRTYTLVIEGKTSDGKVSTVRIGDVLVGEVWLASGQSNMDFRVAATPQRTWCGLEKQEEVIAAANYPSIRMFITEFTPRDEPADDVNGQWYVCSPATVGEFSAVGYLFARELHEKLRTPVGIVLTSFGASTAQAWTSARALKANPKLAPMLDEYAKACSAWDSGEAQKTYEKSLVAYEQASAKAKAEGKPAPRKPGPPRDPHKDQHSPTVLYNGMVSPLIPYAIKGAIWYQGESNGYNANLYLDLMTALIGNWREDWKAAAGGGGSGGGGGGGGGEGGEFPFLSVQLAGYRAPTTQPVESSQIATVRDAQLRSLAIPNTALACAVDVGDAKNVHPKNKQEVARRLALAALHLAYGQATPHSGPTVASVIPEGSTLRIKFDNTFGGLVVKEQGGTGPGGTGKVTGFALRDEAGQWHPADVVVEGDSVVLSSPAVPTPTVARYGWANNPGLSLYGKSGLPVYPFRTDPQ